MNVYCDCCANEFDKKPSEIKRTKHNFCSKGCSGAFREEESKNNFYSMTELSDNGCLVWTGATNKDGYGTKRHLGKIMLAHRVSYLLMVSDIDDGMCVLHSCDNPPCVHPDHLFLGTHQDNMDDMNKKGRRYRKPLPSPPENKDADLP